MDQRGERSISTSSSQQSDCNSSDDSLVGIAWPFLIPYRPTDHSDCTGGKKRQFRMTHSSCTFLPFSCFCQRPAKRRKMPATNRATMTAITYLLLSLLTMLSMIDP